MSVVQDIIAEQIKEREDVKKQYIKILENELIPYLESRKIIHKLLENEIRARKNVLKIEFKFSTIIDNVINNSNSISLIEAIESTCFKESVLKRLFPTGLFSLKQIKYMETNLTNLTYYYHISKLINFETLCVEIFKESSLPEQLIQFANSLGCQAQIEYNIEYDEYIPVLKLNWHISDLDKTP